MYASSPPRPSFRDATVVGQAPSENGSSPRLYKSSVAEACAQEEESGRNGQQQVWQRQEKGERVVPHDHALHRRKQAVHLQQQHAGQEQQEEHDAQQVQPMDTSLGCLQTREELKRSISGIGRLRSVTRLSSGEFRLWRTFLLPTAATALSVPMLIVVGSAPVLCMLLFITCLHNVLTAMFMMHWVCMVAVPLLYVKCIERSFDYYAHVWRVQSCRFAAQWKHDLLLAILTAISFYVIYVVLRRWGGPWFAAVVETARINALVAGLDLPFVSLIGIACYFCLCNPLIEEWFWRVFLYREFGGAVFFLTENKTGIFVLRETPPLSTLWNMVINSQDTTTADLSAGLQDSSGRDVGSESFCSAADASSYQRLGSDVGARTAAETEKQNLGADSSPAAQLVSSSSMKQDRKAAPCKSSVTPSSDTAGDTTSQSSNSSGFLGSVATPVAVSVVDASAQRNAPAHAYSFVARQSSSKFKQTSFLPLLSSRSISIQPTARTDALFLEAADGEEIQEDNVPAAVYSPVASPLEKRDSYHIVAAAPDAAADAFDFRDEGVAAASTRTGEDSAIVHRARVASPPAPDAPVLTRVGGGLLQVDLQLSLLGQIVLSLFYASYHTVVFGALTGTVGGCIAVPCVAILGMVLIMLRNSCVFGLLGGILVHVGVDLGVVLILGAVLQYY